MGFWFFPFFNWYTTCLCIHMIISLVGVLSAHLDCFLHLTLNCLVVLWSFVSVIVLSTCTQSGLRSMVSNTDKIERSSNADSETWSFEVRVRHQSARCDKSSGNANCRLVLKWSCNLGFKPSLGDGRLVRLNGIGWRTEENSVLFG